MKRKSLLLVLTGYVLWGVLPLYWHILNGVDSMVILACRIVASAVTTTVMLAATRRLPEIGTMLRDKRTMKYLIPAAIFITINWGTYIWAVGVGRVTDSSLGYYMNPLMVFLAGILVFRERCGKLELFALLLAAAGVVLATLQFGEFPVVALTLAVCFALYGMFKKMAHVNGLVSVCVETLILMPLAVVFLFVWPTSQATFAALTPVQWAAILGTGVATAVPLILYSEGVNDLPFTTMGFLQYVSPTLMLLSGVLVMGESFSAAKAVSFGFIWVGLILFTIGLYRREHAQGAALKPEPAIQNAE